ncbi:unnamed protein product [Acanthoscelides obtectus]|uniref:Inositol-pentakisphosphate 2-kinase n=1 Tax=Acanthoscelides obtectus TaxID=200917 RepID=A0A9P0MH09_ACAOB|nr:unnamed protein product [Acanthoscelides obtectus]CAK1620041.1 Inositol-pentakisphosphate 2-kinase [Acanthoscelides obtectus]
MVTGDNDPLSDFQITEEWIYRGEGNCNVVLSLPKSRKILRIRKIDRPRTLIGWLIVWINDFLYWYCGKGIKEELRDLKFYSTVMRPLVGRRYTSEADQVFLSRKQIKIFEDSLGKYRPEFRKQKILQYSRASLFDDFAFIPKDEYEYLPFEMSQNTYAIEIKPKQGWRPLSEKHFPACLFCMHQYLKAEKKQIRCLSKYCPEDLFSGDDIRMKYAIKSLIEVPQNNFRIFKNGKLVYGEGVGMEFCKIVEQLFETYSENLERLRDEFCDLIRTCLLTNLANIDSSDDCEDKLFCEWNKIIQEANRQICLPKGSILEKILSIQMLDTEGCSYYNKLLSRERLKEWDYVDMLLNKISDDCACLKCVIMMLGNTSRAGDELDLKFVPYLISAIAKDCSLMITLKKIRENISDLEMKNVVHTNLGQFLVNVGVFDLYPKRLSSITKHCKRNKEILQAYQRATST